MDKLVSIPGELKNHIVAFRSTFTKQSYENFSYMVASIAACKSQKTLLQLYGTIADVCENKKTYQAYLYFFNKAKWDEDEIAQKAADLFFKAVNAETGKRILIIIDDTLEEKKGEKTFGVGKFWDHKTKKFIWGNNIVTSVIQHKNIFIPHKAKIYVREDQAEKYGVKFRKKHEIAYEDIIKPLRIPKRANVCAVVDAAYFNDEFITNCRRKRYHVIGRIKKNSVVLGGNSEINIEDYFKEKFKRGEWKKTTIKVRGKEHTYYTIEDMINLQSIGKVKVVASKKDICKEARYYGSTNRKLPGSNILYIYENRWNIETVHKESNQKLGFKDYQMQTKQAIERTFQLIFLVWVILLLLQSNKKGVLKNAIPLREMIESLRTMLSIESLLFLFNRFGMHPPLGDIIKHLKELGYNL